MSNNFNQITLAIDLEGTLISHASTMVPRPGLYEFLEFCCQQFERVVFLSFVDEERGRQILNIMADSGHMPDWVRSAEYFHVQGGRPSAKDLRQLGVEPDHALLVDDQPQVLPKEQLHRLVQVPEFKAPFSGDDHVLDEVRYRILQKRHNIWVCGATEVEQFRSKHLTHLITIANPGSPITAPAWFSGDHLQLYFGDVISEQDARACRTKAASADDIQQAIVFYRVARQLGNARLLVTCDYGASRSPAVAYLLRADQLGPGYEAEALRDILAVRPDAVPNMHVVNLGDLLLGRQGALTQPFREYLQQIEMAGGY